MDEYLVPTQFGEDEFYEKKSHFIGRAWPVETEEEALEKIQAMKKQHYDATHNCWAYVIKDGPMRFSDDGEPGGTAGNPMMQVLQKDMKNSLSMKNSLPAERIEICKTMIFNKTIYTIDCFDFTYEDFGKCVFLTKEAAEQKVAELLKYI